MKFPAGEGSGGIKAEILDNIKIKLSAKIKWGITFDKIPIKILRSGEYKLLGQISEIGTKQIF